jgi:hypothetical protein
MEDGIELVVDLNVRLGPLCAFFGLLYGRSAERASRLPLIEHEAQTRQPERWFALRRLLGGAA